MVFKVRRVQKYVETLDILKIKNENQKPMQVQQRNSNGPNQVEADDYDGEKGNGYHPQASMGKSTSETVVTTRWEIFDAMPPLVPTTSSTAIPTAAAANNNSNHVHPKFNWEFFDWKIFIRILLCIIVWCVIEVCYFCWFDFSFFLSLFLFPLLFFVYLILLIRTIPFVIKFNKWVSFLYTFINPTSSKLRLRVCLSLVKIAHRLSHSKVKRLKDIGSITLLIITKIYSILFGQTEMHAMVFKTKIKWSERKYYRNLAQR